MSGKRQKIQYLLALEPMDRGETPVTGYQGTEPVVAKPASQSPALTEQLMEEVCDRANRLARSPPTSCLCPSLTQSNRRGTRPVCPALSEGWHVRSPPIPIVAEQRSFWIPAQACPIEIGDEVLLEIVVAGHRVALAALLAQPHP